MITTPGQLNQRAEFYHQLGTLIAAGVSAPQALETLLRTPPAHSYRKPLMSMIDDLGNGFTVDEAFARYPGFAPQFDLALIETGSASGRLDMCFKLLSNYYRERARLVRQVISDLLYPIFLIHFAAFVFPLIGWFQHGNWQLSLLQFLGTLLPIYAIGFFIIYAFQGKRGLTWRSALENVVHAMPLLGQARRDLALARLATSLEALLSAGVPIITGWRMAAAASGSPALGRVVGNWAVPLETGSTPAELVSQSRYFPETFSSLYNTGEISGKLDESLRRLHVYYQEEAFRKMRMIGEWFPRFVYLIVAMTIAFKVITGWMSYFSQIDQLTR